MMMTMMMITMIMMTMAQVADEKDRGGPELPIQPRIASKKDHPQRGKKWCQEDDDHPMIIDHCRHHPYQHWNMCDSDDQGYRWRKRLRHHHHTHT